MQARADGLAGVLTRAERERRMPSLIVVSSDESLLALEAQDALRQAARALGYTEREVLNPDARFDWSMLAQATRGLSLFAERRIIEVRLPTGKPGVDGAAALESLAEAVPDDTLTLIALPRLERQEPRGALGARTRDAPESGSISIPLSAPDCRSGSASGWRGSGRMRLPMRLNSLPIESKATCSPRIRKSPSLRCCIRRASLSLDQVRDAVLNVARYDVVAAAGRDGRW